MVRKNTIRMVLVCACLFLWVAVPTAFNIAYAITITNTTFRFNVWTSAIICVLLCLSNIRNIKINRFDIAYLIFVIYCMVNTSIQANISSKYLSSGIDALLTLILPYILLKTVFMLESDLVSKVFTFIKALAIYITIQTYATNAIALIRGWSEVSDRASTTLGESNTTAGFLIAIALLLLISYIKNNSRLDLIIFGFTVIAILMSQTRSAIGLLALFIAVIFFVYGQKTRWKIFMYMAVGAVAIYLINPEIYNDIYLRIFTSQSSGSDQLRKTLREIGLLEFYKHPLFGSGNGLLIYRISRVARYSTDIGNTHNQWVALLAESGITGLLLFVAFVLSYTVHFKKCTKETNVVSICFLIFVALGFLFETFLTAEIRTSLCFWIYPLMMIYFAFGSEYELYEKHNGD